MNQHIFFDMVNHLFTSIYYIVKLMAVSQYGSPWSPLPAAVGQPHQVEARGLDAEEGGAM